MDGAVTFIKNEWVNDLSLAYALTIHKVQGSEFPCVIVIIHKSHAFMHHRNLLYTAVTRAKKSVAIFGDPWGIANCAGKVEVDRRATWIGWGEKERSL
jgi:exodeoxyribonuclease V alpha subunit